MSNGLRAATRRVANFSVPIFESDEAGYEKVSLFREGLLTCGVIFITRSLTSKPPRLHDDQRLPVEFESLEGSALTVEQFGWPAYPDFEGTFKTIIAMLRSLRV